MKINLVNTLKNFNNFNDEEKIRVRKKVSAILDNMYEDFFALCKQDKQLNELLDKLDNINNILEFDFSAEFYSGSYNYDVKYSNKLYNYEKKLAENYEKIVAEIKSKIEKLENSKTGLFKQKRIQKLEEQLKQINASVKHYKNALEKKKLQEYYLENVSTLFTPLEQKAQEIIKKYADKTFDKYLSKYPIIIACPKSIMHLSHRNYINSDYLNNVLQNNHDEILDIMINETLDEKVM